MNKEQRALLALLRAGLWERSLDDLSDFPLSAESWRQVLCLSRQQTVTGLVFQGLQYLADEMMPPESVLIHWAAEVDAIERSNRKMNKALADLLAMFKAKGLNPVLQKGQGLALLYEQPLLRECGDIDLYFNNDKAWEMALCHVRLHGICVKNEPDQSGFYRWQGIEVEHHPFLFDLYNPFLRCLANKLEQKWGYRHCMVSEAMEVMVPAPFLNLLLIDLHILKHALGRGIGLRQLCDMARACYCLHSEINSYEMKEACRSLGLERWNPLLHTFMVEYLGLPVTCLPYSEQARSAHSLLDIVWRGGNFGQYMAKRKECDARSVWTRKWQTLCSFLRNMNFSCHYAPKEAFWLVLRLLKGQF